MNKLPAIVLITGSVVFLIAAFMPISFVYAERDVLAQVARVQSSPVAWVISQILFGLGGILVAVGLALFTLDLHSTNTPFSGYLGLALIALGTLCWVVIVYYRATLPNPGPSVSAWRDQRNPGDRRRVRDGRAVPPRNGCHKRGRTLCRGR